MAVLPKFQLKLLFESGDLITQTTLYDLIDASYNPTLVAGTNVTLNSVVTPSRTTITVNAQGGGSGVVTSLTTTGTSGAATLASGVLNIPIYSAGSGGTYTNATAMPQSFPGVGAFANIAAGSTFTNQTFTEMMNKMLYPTLNPALTNPSNGFTLAQSGLKEINETTALSFSSTFNQGSINPQYTSASNKRSGLPNTYNYTGTGVSSNASSSLSDSETVAAYTVLTGAQSWTGSVSFDAGVQPKNSGGGNFDSPLSAGTTSAITRTITGVYPVFATTTSVATMTKQSLQVMTTNIIVDVVTESGAGGQKQKIDIPDAWATIAGLQQFNTLSGTFDTINLATFTQTAVTQTIQGLVVNYTRYTHNGGQIGARQLKFTT